MKGFGLWVLFLAFGTALLWVCLTTVPDGGLEKSMELTKPSRKLKEENIHDGSGYGNVDSDDYLPNDPVPSSKAASLRPGPIQHGTPLIPYIPRPAPPAPNEP